MQDHNINIVAAIKRNQREVKEAMKYSNNKKSSNKAVDKEILEKLNTLAQKMPFCCRIRQRDHDPL
jgi:hypothetical protein